MEFEKKDRDPFEDFEAFDASQSTEIDFDLIDEAANESEPEPDPMTQTMSLPAAQVYEPETIDTASIAADEPKPIKGGFSWTAFGGGLAALIWIAGAIGGPLSYYGIDALMALDPALQAGLIALAFGPSVLFWLAAAAVGEAVKARRVAAELARLVRGGETTLYAEQVPTLRLTSSARNDIETLNDAVAATLVRLNELESSARRNATMFDQAIAATHDNAQFMAGRLAAERNALVELNAEMRGQTDQMAHSIGRQVRLMREASKLVKTEITAAEDALESHLGSFTQSASVLAERTADFHQVADTATAATASLNTTMSGVLDGLGEATKLTDAARRSAEQAVLAANETATAVRDTTRHAVFEAKKAAQAIRAETQALQENAAATLDQLRLAAEAARAASEESQAAADRHAASIEKRLSALASTAAARKPAAAPAPAAPVSRPEPRPAPAPVREENFEAGSLHAAAAAAVARGRTQPASADEPRQRGFGGGLKGFGGWSNLFPHREDGAASRPAAEPAQADAFELADFGAAKADPDAELKANVIEMLLDLGVDIDATLQPADLEQIAQRSRLGAVARRRAVAEAAPGIVARISRHVKRDADARLLATEFRSRPDLAKSDKKGEGSNLVRAYLLVDSALD